MQEDNSSSWLAGPNELRELHVHEPPAPPPPPPRQQDAKRLKNLLVDQGIFLPARDPKTRDVYYYNVITREATWLLDRFVEVHYHALLKYAGVDASNGGGAVALASPPPSSERKTSSHGKDSNTRGSPRQNAKVKGSTSSLTAAQWRERILDLYSEHDPSKMPLVDELLARYSGQEDELWRHLLTKYVPGSASSQPTLSSAPGSLSSHKSKSQASPASARVPKATPTRDTEKAPPPPPPPHHLNHHVGECEDPNAQDAFMHMHHGDTHAVSYHQQSPSRSPPRSIHDDEEPNATAPTPTRLAFQGSINNEAALASGASATEQQQEQQVDGVGGTPLETPDVSVIHEQSEAEEIEAHRYHLARARQAAEDKAKQILASAMPGGNKKVVSQGKHVVGSPRTSRQAWAQELERREEDVAARRRFVLQEREKARLRKEEEMRRRAAELQRLRELEQQISKSARNDSQLSSPRDPESLATATATHSKLQSEAVTPSPNRKYIRANTTETPNTKTTPMQDGHSPSTAKAVDYGRPSPSPTRSTRKLSAAEMRESVERLYRVPSSQGSAQKH